MNRSDACQTEISRLFVFSKGHLVMELLWFVIPVMALVAFDLVALRFGADSRLQDRTRANWW